MGIISGSGITQPDLVTFLTLMNTQLTAVFALLDADTGVTATDYVSGQAITFPTTEISAEGIRSQGAILDFLNDWLTAFNAALAKLDDDGAITATNWASLWAITDVIDSDTEGNLYQIGVRQSQLVNFLQTCIDNMLGLNTKLDADGNINTTTYRADGNITDTIDNDGCED